MCWSRKRLEPPFISFWFTIKTTTLKSGSRKRRIFIHNHISTAVIWEKFLQCLTAAAWWKETRTTYYQNSQENHTTKNADKPLSALATVSLFWTPWKGSSMHRPSLSTLWRLWKLQLTGNKNGTRAILKPYCQIERIRACSTYHKLPNNTLLWTVTAQFYRSDNRLKKKKKRQDKW